MTTEEWHDLEKLALNEPWFASKNLKAYLATHPPDTPSEATQAPQSDVKSSRGNLSSQQLKSIHLWLELLAAELDKNGHTVQNIVEKIRRAEIRPNKTVLKEVLWRPYQLAALGKESTTELTKGEVDKVYEGLNKFIGQEFEIHVPFPSDSHKEEIQKWAKPTGILPEYPEDIYPDGPTF